MEKSRKMLVRYIDRNIDDILHQDRCRILNIIAQNCGCDIIYEEGTGVRIRYSDMDEELLKIIKHRIIEGKKKTVLKLSDSSDTD